MTQKQIIERLMLDLNDLLEAPHDTGYQEDARNILAKLEKAGYRVYPDRQLQTLADEQEIQDLLGMVPAPLQSPRDAMGKSYDEYA